MSTNLTVVNLASDGAPGTLYTIYTGNVTANVTNGTTVEGSSYSLAESIILGTFLALFVLLAVVGNILVCVAVFTDRRLKKLNNFFLVSLAIADLLVAFVMVFAIIHDIMGKWMFGPVFCNIWISLDIMCSTASIINLCVISLDRYIHIRDPFKYQQWMKPKIFAIMVSSVWIMSLIISFLPIHLGWHRDPPGLTFEVQDTMSCAFELNIVYAVVSSTISFYIPCIVMVAIYVAMFMLAQRTKREIERYNPNQNDRLHSSQGSGGNRGTRVSDHKAAVTLGVIMGTFLFCWMPFFIVNIVAAFCRCVPAIMFQILTWLGYVNSCLNPIIYSIFNREFRDAFRRILFPKSCQCITNECFGPRNLISNSNSRTPTKSSCQTAQTALANGSSKDTKEPLCTEKITAL